MIEYSQKLGEHSVISKNKFSLISMKNWIHVMKDLSMIDKLKVYVFDMVEKFESYSFRWLRRVF